MISKKQAALLICVGLSSLLTACAQQSDKDAVAEAQFCMDKATAATANSCLTKIASITTPQAYALRCAAGFITAGVTSSENLSKVINAVQSDGSGTTAILANISLGTVAAANETADNCNLSQQKGLALIGALAKSATNIMQFVGGSGGTTEDQFEAALTNLISQATGGTPGAAEAVETVGSTVQSVYTVTCGLNTTGTTDICNSIDDAASDAGVNLSTATPADIGNALLAYWNAHH